ncbi:unnamed protein product [Owenia fusiformis]|uniref:Uncharacterized protein n=1 Tax=Owenia fusiformis TaxID=6347 RepID=A0A8S4NYL2_OWEFU|nr:unnamed protein product [Owenia fusiformis]
MADPNESLMRFVLVSALNMIIHGPQLPNLDGLKSARSEYKRRRFRRYREKVETRARNLLQFLRQFERLTIGTMHMIDWIITDAFKKVQYKEIRGRDRSIKGKNLKFTDTEWIEKFSQMFAKMKNDIDQRFDKKSKTKKNAKLKLKTVQTKVKVLGTFMELSGRLLNIPQLVDVGCPMYGCKSTASFAYEATNFPLKNVSILWGADWSYWIQDGVQGCVGNQFNILCPILRPSCVGYLSLKPTTGEMNWLNGILRYPVLPIMDAYGDFIASDGAALADFKANGTAIPPVIDLDPDLTPIFSLSIADSNIFLLASEGAGRLVTYYTNGIPHASEYLTDTVNNKTGLWVPIAPPSINGIRAYIMTGFRPDGATDPKMYLRHRLYAVDLRDVAVNRIDTKWYFDFEPGFIESKPHKVSNPFQKNWKLSAKKSIKNKHKSYKMKDHDHNNLFKDTNKANDDDHPRPPMTSELFQVLSYDKYVMVMMPLDAPEPGPVPALPETLWILEDSDNAARVKQALVPLPIKQIAINDNIQSSVAVTPLVWGATGDHSIMHFFHGVFGVNFMTGKIERFYNLTQTFGSSINITSKLMVTGDPGNDVLYMGIQVLNKTQKFSQLCQKHNVQDKNSNYIIALNTTDIDVQLLWMLPSYKDGQIVGQIAATSFNDNENAGKSDILVAYSQSETLGSIWAVSGEQSDKHNN